MVKIRARFLSLLRTSLQLLQRCLNSMRMLLHELANLLAEAPSPPPSRTNPFNKLILDFLNIEAKHGENSDRYGRQSN